MKYEREGEKNEFLAANYWLNKSFFVTLIGLDNK